MQANIALVAANAAAYIDHQWYDLFIILTTLEERKAIKYIDNIKYVVRFILT